MDKDFDGILSHDEITEELQENVKKKFNDFKVDTYWTVLGVYFSYLNRKTPQIAKCWKAWAMGSIAFGLVDLYKTWKYSKRWAQGHN